MKIAIKIICPLFLLAGLLTACSGAAAGSNPTALVATAASMAHAAVAETQTTMAEVRPNPTAVMGTAISVARTEFAETQLAITEAPPTMPPATPIPNPNDVAPPGPDEQVYIDPDGWYSLNFPASMKSFDKPNVFIGPGSLETGYLPKLGYMPKAMDVCIWLANFELKPDQSAIGFFFEGFRSSETACYAGSYFIRENVAADLDHRFIYVKTDGHQYINYKLFFLRRQPEAKPATTLTALAIAYQASFWANLSPMPPGISVAEYTKQPTGKDDQFHFVPTQAWPTPQAQTNSGMPQKTTLEKLGYELKAGPSSNYPNLLYRDGRLLLENILSVSPVYIFSTASGPITAFTVDVDRLNGRKMFLIQNDAITNVWSVGGVDEEQYSPILYRGELLWKRLTHDGHILITKSNGEIVFTFATYFGASFPSSDLKAWNGHWVLEVNGYVIQDGEAINLDKDFDFKKIFGRNLIHDKPFHFFRKDGKVGISYGGKILPLQYDDIAYDDTSAYFDAVPPATCCDNAAKTPYFSPDSVLFYANQKDTGWRYVVVKFKDTGVK